MVLLLYRNTGRENYYYNFVSVFEMRIVSFLRFAYSGRFKVFLFDLVLLLRNVSGSVSAGLTVVTWAPLAA